MEGRLGRTQVWRLKTWARDPHRHEANCVAVLGALEVGRSCALRGAGQRGLCVEPGGPALRPGRWVPPRPAGAAGLTPLTASPAARRRDSRRGPALSQGGVARPWGRGQRDILCPALRRPRPPRGTASPGGALGPSPHLPSAPPALKPQGTHVPIPAMQTRLPARRLPAQPCRQLRVTRHPGGGPRVRAAPQRKRCPRCPGWGQGTGQGVPDRGGATLVPRHRAWPPTHSPVHAARVSAEGSLPAGHALLACLTRGSRWAPCRQPCCQPTLLARLHQARVPRSEVACPLDGCTWVF